MAPTALKYLCFLGLIAAVYCTSRRCYEMQDVGRFCGDGFSTRTRYYFDSERRRCLQFQYKGCGGNNNQFSTWSDCEETCGRSGSGREYNAEENTSELNRGQAGSRTHDHDHQPQAGSSSGGRIDLLQRFDTMDSRGSGSRERGYHTHDDGSLGEASSYNSEYNNRGSNLEHRGTAHNHDDDDHSGHGHGSDHGSSHSHSSHGNQPHTHGHSQEDTYGSRSGYASNINNNNNNNMESRGRSSDHYGNAERGYLTDRDGTINSGAGDSGTRVNYGSLDDGYNNNNNNNNDGRRGSSSHSQSSHSHDHRTDERIRYTDERPRRCNMLKDEGVFCRDDEHTTQRKFYFDNDARRCLEFQRKPCGGNENVFNSWADCEDACGVDDSQSIAQREQFADSVQQGGNKPAACYEPLSMGTDTDGGRVRRWFYLLERNKCNRFWYYKSGGTENNFETREECERMCKGM